jgi:surface polysaccharide O-acyltransferase-like enzyme
VVKKKNKNIIYIELLRILAIFMVMYDHTGDRGKLLYVGSTDTASGVVFLFAGVLCKAAVPLFLMISGALLLAKDNEGLKDIFRKRIMKFLLIFIFFMLLYRVYDTMTGTCRFDPKELLSDIFTGRGSAQLWYMYAYTGLLMILPFLRSLVKTLGAELYIYLFAVRFLFGSILPVISLLTGVRSVSGYLDVAFFLTDIIFYPLMGYYVQHVMKQQPGKKAQTAIMTFAAFMTGAVAGSYLQLLCDTTRGRGDYPGYFVEVMTVGFFLFIKTLSGNPAKDSRGTCFISLLGSGTFGVYLLERAVREQTAFIYDDLKHVIHSVPACIIWLFAAFAIAEFITLVYLHIYRKLVTVRGSET